ncbi:MAG: peptidoglycan recognition family protein [Pseudomonadota bacterium]
MLKNRRKFLKAVTAGTFAAATAAGAWYWPRRWDYIVVHHSAGNYGTIEFLQQVHRERQPGDPIDAIPYHFVIGNGNGLGMGEVASDWRREKNLWGTHLSANNRKRNFFGLGICLIGNFEERQVPQAQFDALVQLTQSLMRQYNIPLENVLAHGHIDGESSKCPGRHFPMQRFKQAIA